MHDGTNGDRIVPILVGDHHGLLGDASHSYDCGVRLVDDGQAKDGAELAGVGDGESRSFDILGLELLGASTLAQIGDAALQAEEVEVAGIFQDGNDQAPVESNGDADVDIAV